jgi:hypothetical protein
MPNPSWKTHLDRLSSDWLDGCDGEERPGDVADLGSLSGTGAEHYFADLLLVDALLSSMADGADGQRERRVRRVMEAIDAVADPSVERPSVGLSGRWMRQSLIAASAACLLIAAGLFSLQFTRNSLADEVLGAVNRVTAQATDRVYAIHQTRAGAEGVLGHQARLYLRGRSGFVITCGQGVLGRNADQFWLVDSRGRVTVADDFRGIARRLTRDEIGLRFLQELSLESQHIPLMQLAAVAELMQHHYVVTLTQDRHRQRDVDLLIGHRRRARPELPALIQLWADVDTRIIQRAELDWEAGSSVVLELLPDESVPPQWYGYQAHCYEADEVRQVPAD